VEVLKMKVIFLAKEKEEGQGSEPAKQDEYISEHVNMRQLGLEPGQLGSILGLLDWQKKTFPEVLKELKEAEEHVKKMESDDSQADVRTRIAIWHARTAIQVLLDSLKEYMPESG
jgi:hypothetical protein